MVTNKNSPEAGTCFKKNYSTFFEGFNSEIKDTFFFAFVIQFLLISMMYMHVGHGKYWKILFYSSIAGLCGAITEHATVAFICQKSQLENHTKAVPLLFNEIFWILSEYSIPLLNLIKMKSLMTLRAVNYSKYSVQFLFIPFVAARVLIGWDRMMNGYLNSDIGRTFHGVAFGIMAIADIICTSCIIYFIHCKMNTRVGNYKGGVLNYLRESSYTVLILVDIVSITLSILYIISTIFPGNPNYESSINLFHCLKSNFLLILATDALIFRYESGVVSTNIEENVSDKENKMIGVFNSNLFKSNFEDPIVNWTSIDITKSAFKNSANLVYFNNSTIHASTLQNDLGSKSNP